MKITFELSERGKKAFILLEKIAHKLTNEYGGEDAMEMSNDIRTASSWLEAELDENA